MAAYSRGVAYKGGEKHIGAGYMLEVEPIDLAMH